ncbi:HugZ family protein [uncultured Roseibium sp.]|uniref:HugZ family pyridoxamine 5'-phosphate oxidase n=1 Tax=uncultured Roseibium sp. TaxID=1936171 RepID=UPI002613BE23|nr:HugZ family protein [uncultured Roseibium sp.]
MTKSEKSGLNQKSVIRETSSEAVKQAKTLIRTVRFGALAANEADTGHPLASRVAVATDLDGTPVILTSALSGHSAAILQNPSCSLLLGEPGKGDPLAHPRISLFCKAVRIERKSDIHERLRSRYLARHPKAELYIDFGDFSFFRLEMMRASLNSGFGKAYELNSENLLTEVVDLEAWAAIESGAIDHMNSDHGDVIKLYAEVLCKAQSASWRLAGLDPEGLDLVAGDKVERLFFLSRLESSEELRQTLVDLAKQARSA